VVFAHRQRAVLLLGLDALRAHPPPSPRLRRQGPPAPAATHPPQRYIQDDSRLRPRDETTITTAPNTHAPPLPLHTAAPRPPGAAQKRSFFPNKIVDDLLVLPQKSCQGPSHLLLYGPMKFLWRTFLMLIFVGIALGVVVFLPSRRGAHWVGAEVVLLMGTIMTFTQPWPPSYRPRRPRPRPTTPPPAATRNPH
jgi:hypothetical protein